MIAVAAVGVAAAVFGVIVAWRLLAGLNDASGETLAVTVDALNSIEDTIDVADATVAATSEALTELETTLSTLAESLDTGGVVVADSAALTETAAPALADATITLRRIESIGTGIDEFLGGVASVPFTPDYNQDAGLGATFGRLADDIDPLDEELAATADSLKVFEGSLADLRTDVDGLITTIAGVNQELADGEVLLVQYRSNVAEARTVADQSLADINRDQTTLQLLVVLAGAAFALAQLVPLWLGLTLLASGGPPSLPEE